MMKVQYSRPLVGDLGHIHTAEDLNVVEGQIYNVLGIVTTPEGCWYFLVDAYGVPMQRLAKYFRIVSHTLPPGWYFNYFPDKGVTVQGPAFLVGSPQAVDDMVDLRPYQLANVRRLLEDLPPEK